jgi:hypothetical protein
MDELDGISVLDGNVAVAIPFQDLTIQLHNHQRGVEFKGLDEGSDGVFGPYVPVLSVESYLDCLAHNSSLVCCNA